MPTTYVFSMEPDGRLIMATFDSKADARAFGDGIALMYEAGSSPRELTKGWAS